MLFIAVPWKLTSDLAERLSLAEVGVKPGDVTDILITHVHTDHTGGLLARGEAVFNNAVVHVGAPDIDFFLDPSNSERSG